MNDSSGRVMLHLDESELLQVPGTGFDLLESTTTTRIKTSGTLVLTTHRLVWVPDDGESKQLCGNVPAVACQLLHVEAVYWGHKQGDAAWFLPTRSARICLQIETQKSPCTFALRMRRPPRLVHDIRTAVLRLRAREHQVGTLHTARAEGQPQSPPGVSGALCATRNDAAVAQQEVEDASQAGLEELASRGAVLVELASHLRSASDTVEQGNKEYESVVDEAGLGSAPSSNSTQLAKELIDALQPLHTPVMLPEAFCRLNRRRGASLVSPQDVLNAAKALPSGGPQLITLPAAGHALAIAPPGRTVSELAQQVDALLLSQCSTGESVPSITEAGVSAELQVPPALAQCVLEHAEEVAALLCRDDSPHDGVTRFFLNRFFNAAGNAHNQPGS